MGIYTYHCCQGICEIIEGGFGGSVGYRDGISALSLRRRDVDDAAARWHMRHHGIYHVHWSVYIRLVCLIEFLLIEILKHVDRGSGTSVVDCVALLACCPRTDTVGIRRQEGRCTKNVNVVSIEAIQSALDNFLRSVESIDAGLDDEGLATSLTEHSSHRLATLCRAIRDVIYHHAGAIASKGERNTGTYAVFATGSGDDGDFALQGEGVNRHDDGQLVPQGEQSIEGVWFSGDDSA